MNLRCSRALLLSAFSGVLWLSWPDPVRAQQSCAVFDECMEPTGVCQENGSCQGVPKPNNAACNDRNPCTKDDKCQGGTCRGTPDTAQNGQPCDAGLGKCVTDPVCTVIEIPGFSFAICAPTDPEGVVQCPETDQNECTLDVCNPQTGQCQLLAVDPCQGECGSCEPSTGECTANPKPNGAPCDDFNECTSNDGCSAGNCIGGGGTGPTITRTPTLAGNTRTRTPTPSGTTPTRTFTVAVATSTPTRTFTVAISTATPTLTVTVASTATRTVTRTATSGATRTNTPTPTAAPCFGDCNNSGTLTASDIGRINSTILRCGPCAGGVPGGISTGCATLAGGCVAADLNTDGCLRASELGRANQNILRYPPNGCPTPTP